MKLDLSKVTQFVLKKQHLLKGYKAANVVQATKDIIGLHATNNATPYLSLLERVKNFEKRQLDHEMYRYKSLARIECMRSTLFIVSKETIPIVYQIYKVGGVSEESLKDFWGMSLQEYEKISQRILKILKNEIMTISQIKSRLPDNFQRTIVRKSGKNVVRISNVKIVLILMQKQGILISMKRPGVWKVGSPNYYTRFTDWLPDVNLNKITRNEAMIQLIKSYIQSYGPVTEKDISWWTGFKVNRVRNLLESLKHELIECEISGLESKFMMLKSDFNCFKQFKPIKRYSISLLPYEDSYVKGYIERERLVSSELHDNAYNYGEARPTILLNGQIVGTWKLRSKQDELTFHLFQTIEKPLLNRSYLKAKAIGRFVCGKEVRITEQ